MTPNTEKQWLDTLAFEDYGQWQADTQFTHLMGSGYLIACHTPGTPVKDATTRITISKSGTYRIWARARNWYYSYAPGKFTVLVDGESKGVVLGALMSNDWVWQIAGDFSLKAGTHAVSLHDLTGYFGRCSSLVITDDMDYVPPRPVAEFEKERAKCLGLSLTPVEEGEWDVLVAGGGPGGVPAAIAAARHGMRTVLVTNRPLLGGNASTEAGINFNGASARQPNAREGGIAEELIRLKGHEGCSWTEALTRLAAAEKNLTVIYNMHIYDADVREGQIKSVTARDTVNGTRHLFRAKMFVDSTGDSWMAYAAGADYRIGRESAWQYHEPFAPEQADLLTMSGTIMNPRMIDTGHPVPFRAPEWVPVLPAGRKFGRNIENIGFVWWAEAPNVLDDLYDAELARDEIFRVFLAYFNYLKNLWEEKEKAANYVFEFMNYVDAKRESRRILGDYILTQQDCMEGRDFPDTVCHAGWPIDLHHPKGIYSGEEGPFFSNTHVPLVKIPYRCLYSENIGNLFMAGRNISVTHIALGTTRLQGTIANMGQAVGTAASLCIAKGITPRELGKNHLSEYRQQLLRDDQYIPGLKNADEKDLARTAEVTASSVSRREIYVNRLGTDGGVLPLDCQRATFLARGVSEKIDSVWLQLLNETGEEAPVTVHVRVQEDPDGYTTKEDLCTVTEKIPAGRNWAEFPIGKTVQKRYLWFWIDAMPGISWGVWNYPPLDWTRSERKQSDDTFVNIRNQAHCALLSKPVEEPADCSPENVINGYSRAFSAKEYEWVSDPEKGLPQWIALKLDKPEIISTVQITFDTDMTNNSMLVPVAHCPLQLVTDYKVEAETEEGFKTVAEVSGNYLRRRVHHFPGLKTDKIRITVTGSGDGKTARIFEVRIYGERNG
jgi:hypothetical protein